MVPRTNMTCAIAGRFNGDVLAAVCKELAANLDQSGPESCGVAYCYGNRLEAVQAGRTHGGGLDLAILAELKTDMATLSLNRSGVVQPWIRREQGRAWGFACEGEIPEPDKLSIGDRLPSLYRPEEKLFLHLVSKLNPDDPVGSVEASLPFGLVQPRFYLINSEMLVVGSGALASGSDSGLWFGRAQLVRAISPVRFSSITGMQWERIQERSVVALTRVRRALS
ncbi:MAG: hypothetical protein ABIL25_01600 [candidate division WOR-3 bacterium]